MQEMQEPQTLQKSSRLTVVLLRVFLSVFTAAYACWIFSNSLQNATDSSASSGRVLSAVQSCVDVLVGEGNVVVSDHCVRKSAHFCEFALLGFLCFYTFVSYFFSLKRPKLVCFITASFSTLFVAAADETIQLFVEGRYASPLDVLLDFGGGVSGSVFALLTFLLVLALKCKKKNIRNR